MELTRILVMEDDGAQARLIQRALQRAGYGVDVVSDGHTGLARACHETYDLLLIDQQMPECGGLEVLQRLDAAGQRPPTIMVTGHGDEAVAVEALKRGAGDYIVKDTAGRYLALLPTVIERVLEQQRLVSQKLQAEEALRHTLEALEIRVRERTAELWQANAHLRAEIVERQRAEEALAKLSRRHKLILDAVGEGIYGVDQTGKTTFVNPAAVHMLGWEAETLLDQPIHHSIHHRHGDGTPSDADECLIVKIMREGVSRQVSEDQFWRRDGTSFLVEYVCTPLREGDTITGAVVLFKDITVRKRMEHEMQRADRLALVGQLASGLAHEIGTPLNVIAGNAELLRMQLGREANQATALETIMTQADRITRLVQQLLTFARTKEQVMQPLELAAPLSHALSLLETRFRYVGISTIVDMPAGLPLVWGSTEQLEQVFLNVLVNAWHAMPAGGMVTVCGSVTTDKMVQMTFQDTGEGMSATDLKRACEPFFSTKGDQGTGLGLAICKQILESHHGHMGLHSTVGKGTTVTFVLQRAEAFSPAA